jgi:hypothetical protein
MLLLLHSPSRRLLIHQAGYINNAGAQDQGGYINTNPNLQQQGGYINQQQGTVTFTSADFQQQQ